jgi:hypothetical protein
MPKTLLQSVIDTKWKKYVETKQTSSKKVESCN